MLVGILSGEFTADELIDLIERWRQMKLGVYEQKYR